MKTNLSLFLFVFLLARALPVVAVPRLATPESLFKQKFPNYYGQSPTQTLLAETFYPLGWSNTGKFAFYTEPPVEAHGGYFAHFAIRDLVHDSDLWNYDYEQEEESSAPKKGSLPSDIKGFITDGFPLFSKKLNEYGVVVNETQSLGNFPITLAGDVIDVELITKKEELPAGSGTGKRVVAVSVVVKSKKRGKKTIYEKSGLSPSPLDYGVLGYVLSPDSKRAAVLLTRIEAGYEGPPHVARMEVIGADLKTGWAKPKSPQNPAK